MYLETFYKSFVASAAKDFMNTLIQKDENPSEHAENLAMKSVKIAKALADELNDDWRITGDHVTTFFDPADQPQTYFFDTCKGISESLERIADRIENVPTE